MVLSTLLVACAAPHGAGSDPTRGSGSESPEFAAALADLSAQRWGAAVERLQALLENHPDAAHAWLNLAIARQQLGDDVAARSAYEAALRLDAADCNALVGLGLLERRAGNLEAAERDYRACLSKQPDHAAALVNLGVLQELYLQRLPEALESYRRYLASHDDAEVSAWYDDVNRRVSAYAQN